MRVLKGKKKYFFFLILFLFLTSYQIDKKNIFPLFIIKKVELKNNINLEENLKNKIINYLYNKSLINVDYKEIAIFFSKSKWIESFKINKVFPDKIVIKVNEYYPIAILKKKDKFFIINSNFEITDMVVNKPKKFKVVLVLGEYKKSSFKSKFSEIKKFDISKNIRSIEILNLNRLNIYFKNNLNVKLGDYDINLQMKTLNQVIKKYKNLKLVDLRVKGRAVIK
tara:strand:- start:10774 stop:11445 length:672 start_codon:yes stop_codon:yes gene_type:complete